MSDINNKTKFESSKIGKDLSGLKKYIIIYYYYES